MINPRTLLVLLSVCAASIDAATIAKPLVESNKLRRIIYRSELMKKAQQLQDIADRNNGTRAWGTSGHWETLRWINETISATNYYDVEFQYFNITSSVYDEISVVVAGQSVSEVRGFNGGVNGAVTAPMIYVPNLGCLATDFPSSIAGKIALVQRGTCVQGLKNALAAKAGAVGVVSFNNENPPPDPPTLGVPQSYNLTSFIPSVFMDSQEAGLALVKKLQTEGELLTTIRSFSRPVDKLTANICAETKGGNHNQVITTGAHTDSVKAGPGINDDGSGTMSQMEVAIALSKFSINNAVRWCWWSAEEDGLLGSTYYTKNLSPSEAAKIVLNMDFDMLASPNFAYLIYDGDGSVFGPANSGPDGSRQLEQTFKDYFDGIGKPTGHKAFNGRSDYVGFIEAGIPAGGIATGAEVIKTANETLLYGGIAGQPYDWCYHQACDTIHNLNQTAWITMTKGIAHAVATYAHSIEGFPFPRAPKPAGLTKRNTLSDIIVPNDSARLPTEY